MLVLAALGQVLVRVLAALGQVLVRVLAALGQRHSNRAPAVGLMLTWYSCD